ncbi:MAG: 3-methyl-2-oxobutanoate hydroxymethyltransferase [Verrucomicrobiaceae bacterium]|nr:3-methyl-2-oxobutanoate hydroxymethyltransferase [Verrucomicrobiaceae bacterium]
MPVYHLALGSNQGDRLAHLRQAAAQLRQLGLALQAAPVYETAPVDCPDGSPAFLNTVVRLTTPLEPTELHRECLRLESAAGRPEVRAKNAPRPLDVDLLHTTAPFDNTEALELPHPRLHIRRFVLQPLSDLSPQLVIAGKSVLSHLGALADDPTAIRVVADSTWPGPPHYPILSLSDLPERKLSGPLLSVLTAYDYPAARLLDEAGVDMLLVGDSLGMVVLGLPDTTQVTMEHMLHHVEAVARGAKRAPVIADLPYHSYLTPEQAVANAQRLINAGGTAVKLEGGVSQLPQIEAIIAAGIPLIGHIGMLPQSIFEEGGKYRKKGRTPEGAAAIHADALALEKAGALAVVIESVVPEVATSVTQKTIMSTIGIGSGVGTDGQVLVLHDLVGGFPWFRPPFATTYGNVAETTQLAAISYISQVHHRRS